MMIKRDIDIPGTDDQIDSGYSDSHSLLNFNCISLNKSQNSDEMKSGPSENYPSSPFKKVTDFGITFNEKCLIVD